MKQPENSTTSSCVVHGGDTHQGFPTSQASKPQSLIKPDTDLIISTSFAKTYFNVCSLCDSFWEEISPRVCQSLSLYSYRSSQHICRCLGLVLSVSNAAVRRTCAACNCLHLGSSAAASGLFGNAVEERERAFPRKTRRAAVSAAATADSVRAFCRRLIRRLIVVWFCGKARGLLWRVHVKVTASDRTS